LRDLDVVDRSDGESKAGLAEMEVAALDMVIRIEAFPQRRTLISNRVPPETVRSLPQGLL
jgi:hypothetical protein